MGIDIVEIKRLADETTRKRKANPDYRPALEEVRAINFWTKVEHTALGNPDLPVDFVAQSLISMAEPREYSTPFPQPKSRAKP
jgi:hypothetical protein